MKKILKNILGVALGSMIAFTSCETFELDLTTNPNGLSPEQGDPELFLNAVFEDFGKVIEEYGTESGEIVRIHYLFGRNYQNAYTAQRFDVQWTDTYQQILQDLRTMQPLAEEADLWRHVAMGQVMEAYLMVTVVDLFGDVPYSEALQGADNFNPGADAGNDIYTAALGLLNDAITNFERDDSNAGPGWDPFFDNDYDQWVKVANSLRMKINLQKRLVDNSALGEFNTIAGTGDIMTGIDDNFAFRYGSSLVNPDTRHPNFVTNYTPSGVADYQSNWLMGTMQTLQDPRIRYYFYRQSSAVPGQEIPGDESLLQCSVETPPSHYASSPYYCNLPNGYWGRDHGDDDGTPPDTQIRTAHGVYPIGGRFDRNEFSLVGPSAPRDGGGGAGVTPILLSSTIHFLRAEAAMVANNTAEAATHLRAGIVASIDYVQSFGPLDPTYDPTGLGIQDTDTYADGIIASFNAGNNNDKWNILGTQFFISLFGNGVDGFNFYRRTGYPTTLQPNIEPNPGQVHRSFLYPANYVLRNQSMDQKTTVTQRVFWDNNPETNFPAAN